MNKKDKNYLSNALATPLDVLDRKAEQQLIKNFGKVQQAKLNLRSDKGRLGWRSLELEELLQWLKLEVEELENEIPLVLNTRKDGWEERAMDEAIDCANLSMMIWDKVNEQEK